jgi:UTP--glucose-1-phosphate uridylyltransferase
LVIKKVVIPAAGLGTRFLPMTKAQPKEMLPVVDKPAIQYVVEEAVSAGIKDILIITGRGKRAIEDHFDHSFELEHYLSQRGEQRALAEIIRIADLANIHYARQGEPKGTGHAVLAARDHVGEEPFAVMLGDDIFVDQAKVLQAMISAFDTHGRSIIALKRVPKQTISSYGCVKVEATCGDIVKIERIVEKPRPEDAPSDLAVIGRYIFTPKIFSAITEVHGIKNGEIPLTDAIQLLLEHQIVYGYIFEEGHYDVGQKLSYLQAMVEIACNHQELGPKFRQFLQKNLSK